MKDIKGNFVDCDARAITPRGRKRRILPRRAATGKEWETRGCRLIYAVARDGKNYERNATSRRVTPNLICPHPRPPLGFANKITLEDIGGWSGSRHRPATARLGAITPSPGLYQPLSLSSTCVSIHRVMCHTPASFSRIIFAVSDTAAKKRKILH